MMARLLSVLGVGLLLAAGAGCSGKARDQIPTEVQAPPAEPPLRVGGPPPAASVPGPAAGQPQETATARKPAVAQ